MASAKRRECNTRTIRGTSGCGGAFCRAGTWRNRCMFYGVDGQKIGTYTFTLGQYGQTNTPEMTNSTVLLATFFVHKRVGVFDQLGSANTINRTIWRSRFIRMGKIGERLSRTMS